MNYKLLKRKWSKLKHKMNPTQLRLLAVLKFLIIFNLLSIPVHLIIKLKVNTYPLAFLERAQVSFILHLFKVDHLTYDVRAGSNLMPVIDLQSKSLAIGEPCTAIRSLIAFMALVVASPRQWSSKKKSWVYLPVIYGANIARITTLAFVTILVPSAFDLVHIVLWREGLILLILGLWYHWYNNNA